MVPRVIQREDKICHAWVWIFTRVMLLVFQRVKKNNHALIYIFTRVMLLVIQRVEKNNNAWIYIFTRSIVSRVCAWQRKYPRVKISCENKYRPVMPSRALTGDHFARLAVTRIEAIPFTCVAVIPFTFVFTTSRQHEVTPRQHE